jgi:release factor glutamine methyltransferase
MEKLFGISRHNILTGTDRPLSGDEQVIIRKTIADLRRYLPVQYILGEAEFFGMCFTVNESVLIPRPETEELVELIVNHRFESRSSKLSIFDIGTGSGCIAVSLAKNIPSATVYATDISGKALSIARQNAVSNCAGVNFVLHDIMEDLPEYLPRQFNIIVSNPPYITPSEKQSMHRNVLDYEPAQALFTPHEEPLLFYRRIAELGTVHLSESGRLFFELNPLYAKETKKMTEAMHYKNVILHKDISGKFRFLEATVLTHKFF